MRATFTFVLVVFVFAANAQFTIQPQIGLENSRTSIKYNDQSFVPASMQFSPLLAVHLAYSSKQGHGVFLGVSTSSSAIDFKFSDLQNAATSFNASRQNLQLRFEGGYQFSTKPIYFSKGNSSNTYANKTGRSCGGGGQHFCAGRMNCMHSCSRNANKTSAKNNGSYMRITPSVGLAFIPSQPSEIETQTQGTQTTYDYKAGAWNSAIIAGTAFEFGSNSHAKFVVNINYLQGLGNMDTKTINSTSNGKAIASSISSNTSGWNISVGIPISFTKNNNKKRECINRELQRLHDERMQNHRPCGQYQMHLGCGQRRMQ